MSGGLQQTFEGLENPGVVVHDCYDVSDCACHPNELYRTSMVRGGFLMSITFSYENAL